MKNVMMNVSNVFAMIAFVSMVGCDSQTAAPAAATTTSAPIKTLVQSQGCSTSSTHGGGNITCSDGSSAFIANGTPFRLQDADGHLVGDYLVSATNLQVWDNNAGSVVSYDPTSGLVTPAVLYFESTDCSGQAYAAPGSVVNTAISNAGANNGTEMYKVVSPVASITYNSIYTALAITPEDDSDLTAYVNANGYCLTGNPGSYTTTGTATMAQAIAYPNAGMPVSIPVPASVVMATGN